MCCPKCQSTKTSVVDTRQTDEGSAIRRRRLCDDCDARFTTFERVEEPPLLVIKKNGTRDQFSRDKIRQGILYSAQKRPVSSSDLERVVSNIEQSIRSEFDSEVPSSHIGNLVMNELADLDEITYVRFASVYRSFRDVDEIEELLQQMTKRVRSKKGKYSHDS